MPRQIPLSWYYVRVSRTVLISSMLCSRLRITQAEPHGGVYEGVEEIEKTVGSPAPSSFRALARRVQD